MNKIEVERILPIAIILKNGNPARLELRRRHVENKYEYIGQYKDNFGGCHFGTTESSWDRVYDNLSNYLKEHGNY